MRKNEIYRAIVKAKDDVNNVVFDPYSNEEVWEEKFYNPESLVRWLNAPKKYIDKTARLAVLISGFLIDPDFSATEHGWDYNFSMPSTREALKAYPLAKRMMKNNKMDIWIPSYYCFDGENDEEVMIPIRYSKCWCDTLNDFIKIPKKDWESGDFIPFQPGDKVTLVIYE